MLAVASAALPDLPRFTLGRVLGSIRMLASTAGSNPAARMLASGPKVSVTEKFQGLMSPTTPSG